MNKKKYLIEYGRECELLTEKDGKWKVKIENKEKNEITEKFINYEPIKNEWKYNNKLGKDEKDKYGVLKKYTTYLRGNKLIRAYHFNEIKEFSSSLVYEHEIGDEIVIIKENPFLLPNKIKELQDKMHKEQKDLIDEKKTLNLRLKEIDVSINEIKKKYDIGNKCFHQWELVSEKEINDGQTTEKSYECSVCGKIDVHYWHKL